MRALGHALASWAERRGITADAAGTSLQYSWHMKPSDTAIVATAADELISPVADPVAPSCDEASISPPTSASRTGKLVGALTPSWLGALRSSRWPKALLFGAVALFMEPMVVAASWRGNEGVSTGETMAAGITETRVPGPSAPATPAAAPLPPVEAPTVMVSERVTAARAPHERRSAVAVARKHPVTAMPLPRGPGF